jgi:hypothetical protein
VKPVATPTIAPDSGGHQIPTLPGCCFIYPVAIQNIASRRIAENIHGEIIGNRTNPKYDSVVYRIPFYESPYSQFS